MQRVFTHFLNVAVVNTFLLCTHSGRIETGVTHLKFRQELVEELCADLWSSRQLEPAQQHVRVKSRKQWERDPSRKSGIHFPGIEYTEEGRSLEVTNLRSEGNMNARNFKRGLCMICGQKVSQYCKSCNVYLCIKNLANGTNCFEEFHTCTKFAIRGPVEMESDSASDGEIFL